MPNGDSLFSTFAAAGKAEGVEEAAGINVQAIKDAMASETEKLEWQQQKRDESIDLFSTALDTTSTLYEGHLAKQEFGTYQKGIQEKFAKEKFGKEYTPEQLETLSPTKLTGKGTKWDDASWGERMVSKYTGGTQWRFGEGEGSYKMGKSDIMFAGEASKYGLKTDLSMYKEAEGEGRKAYYQSESDRFKSMKVDSDKMEAEFKRRKAMGGKFYGEKTGVDIGDIVGEKSIFAAGEEKLSNLLSKKTVSGDYDPTNMSDEARKMYEYQKGLDAPKTVKKSGKKTDMTAPTDMTVASEEALPYEYPLNFKSPIQNTDWYNPLESED